MNTMNMPGFTAESSICNSTRDYNLPILAKKRNSTVVPQAMIGGGFGTGSGITIEPEQCIIRCYWRCTRYGCYPTNCYEVCF